jgi:hypothetical protein
MRKLGIILSIIVVLTWLAVINGCDENKKNYIHHVTLTHPDGTVQNWILRDGYRVADGFVYWTAPNGGNRRISGSIVIEPVEVKPPKTEQKEQ